MNLAAVGSLSRNPVAGVWFRALQPHFYATALNSAHTIKVPSRFSPGPHIPTPFEALYLAESTMVAQFEIGAVFGQMTNHISHPQVSFTTIAASVRLSQVIDLSDLGQQGILDVNVQLLTGDWDGYQSRTYKSPVSQPNGIAPTQEIGMTVFADANKIEGIISVSAKCPTHRTLVVFPQNMRVGNFVEYRYMPSSGASLIHRIDGVL